MKKDKNTEGPVFEKMISVLRNWAVIKPKI